MADKKHVLTYNGLKDLEDELYNLKVVKRKDVAEKIKDARAQGDLSENAEYDAAKEEQAEIESRIMDIEKILKSAVVVDEDEIDLNIVSIGCKVKLFDYEYDEEVDYAIVGSTEANPLEYKISDESKVGQKLIGKKVGEIFDVNTELGISKYKVLEIHK